MKTVKISGGLGNQLFQYAFGLYLAEISDQEIFFDPQTKSYSKSWVSRDLGLSVLFGNIPFCPKSSSSFLLCRIKRALALRFPRMFSHYFVEKKLHEVVDRQSIKSYSYFDGYWQCYDYVESIKEIMLNRLSKHIERLQQTDFGKKITNDSEISISIHVRHGDYLSIKKNLEYFNVCPVSYYKSAVEFFFNNFPEFNIHFYIFTDDKEWCQNVFDGKKFDIISGNAPETDLLLMSLCKHNIIANSTFSWWGAYLNQNKSKIVIAPKQWYNNTTYKSLPHFLPSCYLYM